MNGYRMLRESKLFQQRMRDDSIVPEESTQWMTSLIDSTGSWKSFQSYPFLFCRPACVYRNGVGSRTEEVRLGMWLGRDSREQRVWDVALFQRHLDDD